MAVNNIYDASAELDGINSQLAGAEARIDLLESSNKALWNTARLSAKELEAAQQASVPDYEKDAAERRLKNLEMTVDGLEVERLTRKK